MKHLLKDGKISRLYLEDEEGGASGEAHLVQYKGKKYILRKCRTQERADLFEEAYKRFEKYGFLPKLLGKYENNLFFEYIKGRDLNESDFRYAKEVGRILGFVNSEKSKQKFDYNKKFLDRLDLLYKNDIINKTKNDLLKSRYQELRKKVKAKFYFDIGDLSANNFRLSRGKVYFVDIEALNDKIIVLGFAKAFLKWFKEEKQRKEFMKGYDSVKSSRFLTKDYLQFAYLYFLVTNTAAKIGTGKDISGNLRKIDKLIEYKLI